MTWKYYWWLWHGAFNFKQTPRWTLWSLIYPHVWITTKMSDLGLVTKPTLKTDRKFEHKIVQLHPHVLSHNYWQLFVFLFPFTIWLQARPSLKSFYLEQILSKFHAVRRHFRNRYQSLLNDCYPVWSSNSLDCSIFCNSKTIKMELLILF